VVVDFARPGAPVSRHLSEDPHAAAIRVATWNVWWRFGPWKARAEAIATTLRSVNADVYTLQEVWADDGDNLAGQLAAMLDYQWTWAASPRSDRWCRRLDLDGVQLGNAILSRWPLSDPHNELLPDDEDDPEGRLVVGADVGTPWGCYRCSPRNSTPIRLDQRSGSSKSINSPWWCRA
jgi:endonuclease/exonuclease/phosphatase family metal-dependent hydrolase